MNINELTPLQENNISFGLCFPVAYQLVIDAEKNHTPQLNGFKQ